MGEAALVIAAVVSWVYDWPLWARIFLTVLAVLNCLAAMGSDR